jgi:hypothetical protein
MVPKPKSPVLESLGPELGAKVVALVAADMQRAKRAEEQKAEAKAKASKRSKRSR